MITYLHIPEASLKIPGNGDGISKNGMFREGYLWKSIDDNLQGSIIDLIIDGERYPALEHFGGQFKEVTSLHFKIKHL